MKSSDCYELHPEHAAGEIIDGEAVVINLATGVYYSLDGAAGAIWRMVSEKRPMPSMVEELIAAYDVEHAQAARDVRRVLDQLAGEGLIRPAEADARPAALSAGAARAPYIEPEIRIYRDMQDLLALDPPSPGLDSLVWKRSSGQS